MTKPLPLTGRGERSAVKSKMKDEKFMGKILVVAEKPSAGNDMAKVLGCTERKDGYFENEKYIVTWAVGHLIGLKFPEEHDEKYKEWNLEHLPMAFPLSESLKVLPESAKQFQVIKKLIQRTDIEYLINAGDAGREGYLIQEWIYRMAGNRHPVKVLWASSLTEEALKHAFANLHENSEFQHILPEAEARAEADWLLGMNYSRFLTLTKATGTGLSYGRCQTPLLNLIFQRDKAIAEFKSEPYYNIEVTYQDGFNGILLNEEGKKWDIFSEEEANNLLQRIPKEFTITSYKKEKKAKKPPLLLNLAALQKTMGSRFGYTPDKTLALAQNLYEKHKVMSYPRTDSQYLSQDIYNEVREHLECCRFGGFIPYIDSIQEIQADRRYFNDHKVTDHHALIPTLHPNMEEAYKKLSEEERNVFDVVLKSFISIFLPDYEYYVTEILATGNGLQFATKGTTISNLGYKKLLIEDIEAFDQEEDNQELPVLQEGNVLYTQTAERLNKKTLPPKSYTVSTLISAMEKYTIGTSATRAEIIQKLLNPKRPYVRLDKGKYYITQLGADYIKILPETLKSEELTKHFEEQLALVGTGELSKDDFIHEINQDILNNMNALKTESTKVTMDREVIGKCPICGKAVLENSKAFGCSGYSEGCKFAIWKTIAGKNITTAQAKQLLQKRKCGPIKGFKGQKGSFAAYLVLKPDNTVGFTFK